MVSYSQPEEKTTQASAVVTPTPQPSKSEDDIQEVPEAAREVPVSTTEAVVGAAESVVGTAWTSLSSWYSSAKQIVLEKVGKAKVSEDPELVIKINQLKEVKMYYEELSTLGVKCVVCHQLLLTLIVCVHNS
jgi:hypothetical protein